MRAQAPRIPRTPLAPLTSRIPASRTTRVAFAIAVAFTLQQSRADYADVVNAFIGIRANSVFPVPSRSLDDIESAFGPRVQTSTTLHDFHRGIDIDGGSIGDPVGVEDVIAVLDGTFYDYRTSVSGGNTVILEHALPAPVFYQGKSVSKFYTWYLHLHDDGIEGNGVGTADIVSGWTPGDAVGRSTLIGKVGDSGSPASGSYAPHLHFELRLGTPSSLEFQLANPQTTQWGFDPHLNPMLLFPPYTHGVAGPGGYQQEFERLSAPAPGTDIRLEYRITNDDMPLANRFDFEIVQRAGGITVSSHTLDWNQRTGYDASSTATLDSRDLTKPHADPVSGALAGTGYLTELVVPTQWTQAFQNGDYDLRVTATDLWGNTAQFTDVVVPEPPGMLAITATALAGTAWRRHRSLRRGI